MTTRIFTLVVFLLSLPFAANATSYYQTLDLCLGDAAAIQAPAGYVYTYTEPKFGMGYPSMADEKAMASHASATHVGWDHNPVWYEIFPNSDVFDQAPTDPYYAKSAPSNNPVAYMEHNDSEASRAVIHGRAEGKKLVLLWAFNEAKGETIKHYIKVYTRQCGSTTRLPVTNVANFCEGGATHAPQGTSLISSENNIFVFRGEESGMNILGAVAPGRSIMTNVGRRSEGTKFIATVREQGSDACPPAHDAELHPIDDSSNSFQLEICRGELWMSPSRAKVSNVSTSGPFVYAERSAGNDGFALLAQIEGTTDVFVEFDNQDMEPTMIRVIVNSCE
jgi:hypothetical protein